MNSYQNLKFFLKNMIDIVDSHCHLYYEPYVNNLKNTLEECKKNNVNRLLSISVDYDTSLKNIDIVKKFDQVYCSVGLHPNSVFEKKKELKKILNLVNSHNKIIAIGECGVDLFRSRSNLKDQIECFEEQISKSIEMQIPFIVHSRKAEKEVLNCISNFKNKNIKFILHCFSGDIHFANKCIDLGGLISFGGTLTFKNSYNLREVCKNIPLEKLLIETDSPYLSPHPLRGQINHPKNSKIVMELVSNLKNKNINYCSNIIKDNFNRYFNIN